MHSTGMSSDIPGEISVLAKRLASGCDFSAATAAAGLNPHQIIGRLKRGRWRQLFRGVYAVLAARRRAKRGCGPRSSAPARAPCSAIKPRLSCRLLAPPAEAIHVTVPSTRRVVTRGLIIRTSSALNRRRSLTGRHQDQRRGNPLDLVQLSPEFDDVCGWITKVCGRRLTTEDEAAALELRRMRWRDELDDVLAAAGGGSAPCWNIGACATSSVPTACRPPRHQVRVVIDGKVVYRDVCYEEYSCAVELDGRPGASRRRALARQSSGRRGQRAGRGDTPLRLA